MHRVEQLQNHVHLLRENVLQIRELYQSIQDARQNKIMAVITIVTTIFLPLTLITGWYGMNFVYMPELQWRYGYFAVIMISLIIVIAEIIYFKKKNSFNLIKADNHKLICFKVICFFASFLHMVTILTEYETIF